MKILLYLPSPGGMTGAPRRLLTWAGGWRDLGATPIVATDPASPLILAAGEEGIQTFSIPPVGVLALRSGALF